MGLPYTNPVSALSPFPSSYYSPEPLGLQGTQKYSGHIGGAQAPCHSPGNGFHSPLPGVQEALSLTVAGEHLTPPRATGMVAIFSVLAPAVPVPMWLWAEWL